MHTILVLLVVVSFAAPALASDGVLEINQTCATQGGCFSGDAAGFPVTIDSTGSYRLTGNLSVPNEITTAVVVSASSVTLDLNGFEIRGPNSCSGFPTTCTLSGSGFGVMVTGARLRLINGAITGMGGVGVYGPSGEGHVVEDIRTTNNRFEGIRLDLPRATLRRVTALTNGGTGLRLLAGGCSVSDSLVSLNGGDGVELGSLSTAQGNSITLNNGFGISSAIGSNVIRDDTIQSNGAGTFGGLPPINAGGNVCNGLPCP